MKTEEPMGTGEWDGDVVEVTSAAPVLRGTIRDLGEPEREALDATFHRYGDDIIRRIEKQWVLKIIERLDIEPHRRVFAMHRETLADLAPYDPVFLGVPLAHLSRKGARITVDGGRFIAPFATRRTVSINEKGVQLFLYGRHLFARSLITVTGKPEAGDEVLVLDDEDGRYIGIGIADKALRGVSRLGARSGEKEIVVHNRLDLGLYLRAQQEIPE